MKSDSIELSQSPPLAEHHPPDVTHPWEAWRRWGRRLTGMLAVGTILGLNALGIWQPLERLGYTLLFELREHSGLLPNPRWDDRLAIIAIDEATLQAYGQFPLSRDRYAALLEQLAFVQPAAIGIDLLLPDPSPQDQQLAYRVYQNGNVVLAVDGQHQSPTLPIAPEIQRLAGGAYQVGHSNYSPDIDGISRQVVLYQGETPALALALAEMYQVNVANTLAAQPKAASLEGAVPLADTSSHAPPVLTINWPGQSRTEKSQPGDLSVYSMVDVMEGRVDLEVFQNQIVLVGLATSGTNDIRTPLNRDPPIAGAVFHAAVVDNLLNQHWLTPLPPWVLPPLLVAISLLAGARFPAKRLRTQALLLLLLSAGWLGMVILAFVGNLWLPMASPIGTLMLTVAARQAQNRWEGQQLMSLFAMYVAPEMASFLWQQRREILHHGKMPAQELVATVVFVDIRGFTGIAENLTKQELLDWLNRYFAVITDCIMEHGGVVDKYIGDAVMAVFGVPFPRTTPEQIQRDAIAAVDASLAIQNRIEHLNQTLPTEGIPVPPFSIGIGIHTGSVVAGSVGNHQRVNYSVFGDTVNIAARLEKLTKRLPAQIHNRVLMTDSTAALIQTQCPTVPVGHLMLDGRQTTTALFTLTEPGLTTEQSHLLPINCY
ncbi:MAG: adenylate/guanylate cyclase domain-containing protein [Cyanobacteria bacterium J06638_6]